jgi:hypothetical protein
LFHAAETPARGSPRFLERHAKAEVLFDGQRKMGADLRL